MNPKSQGEPGLLAIIKQNKSTMWHEPSLTNWTIKKFDSTLGYPGEGPCSTCGDIGHNIRSCPLMVDRTPK
eukprot:5425880-Karenia_brevis.AAC.1